MLFALIVLVVLVLFVLVELVVLMGTTKMKINKQQTNRASPRMPRELVVSRAAEAVGR